MEDLAGKILEAIGETERIAHEACGRGPEWAIARERPVPWGAEPRPAEILASNKPIMRLYVEYAGQAVAEHVTLHDPERALRRCAADRETVELHAGDHHCREMHSGVYPADWPPAASWGKAGEPWRHPGDEYFEGAPCDTLRALADGYGMEVGE